MKLVFMDETRLDETDHIISVGHVAEILHQKGSFLHVFKFFIHITIYIGIIK